MKEHEAMNQAIDNKEYLKEKAKGQVLPVYTKSGFLNERVYQTVDSTPVYDVNGVMIHCVKCTGTLFKQELTDRYIRLTCICTKCKTKYYFDREDFHKAGTA